MLYQPTETKKIARTNAGNLRSTQKPNLPAWRMGSFRLADETSTDHQQRY
jgi:hypothetical protein